MRRCQLDSNWLAPDGRRWAASFEYADHVDLQADPVDSRLMQDQGSNGAGVTATVAVCRELRANILFGSPMNETRYEALIRICSLERDMEILPDGDMTELAERGTKLSGSCESGACCVQTVRLCFWTVHSRLWIRKSGVMSWISASNVHEEPTVDLRHASAAVSGTGLLGLIQEMPVKRDAFIA